MIEKIVAALETVPEKNLLIVELLNQVTSAEGKINYKRLKAEQTRVNLAVAEAKSYSNATINAVEAVKKMMNSGGELI
uniref:Uncharacterized protein n=1 Tax=viral metagenome TaxID=1070528 RepID=A0A6M3XMN4_9ZZZZ